METSKDCPSCKDRPNATIYPLRRLLMCLSRKIDTLPQALFLDGVDCKERDPVFLGGYADIFLASYQGQKVALKRLRTCATASSEVKLKNVSAIPGFES